MKIFKVAERLSKEPKVSYVYSSDLKRAFETAQIIAARCGNLEVLINLISFFTSLQLLLDAIEVSQLCVQVLTDPHLRERHLGDMQGLVYQEASKLRPEAYKAFSSNRTDVDIPVS